MRVSLSQAGQVILTNLVMTPAAADVAVSTGDIAFGAASPTEGAEVSVTATLRNSSSGASGPLTAAFYAQAPGWGDWYIGGAFVPSIPGGGSAQAVIPWNTLGFTGNVPVRVVVDPYDRLTETNEGNNDASASLTILTRPDLRVPLIALDDAEPVVSQTVTVQTNLRNDGQTAAGDSRLALYQGRPADGGLLLGDSTLAVSAQTVADQVFNWTPTAPGPYRLFSVSDEAGEVDEFDEGNNQSWQDVYVGLAGPLNLDSGGASDLVYTSTVGFGVVDVGQPDLTANCDGGSSPQETLRRDPTGEVVYRFDHLLPGHFYHLNLTMAECDNAGRQQSVTLDGNPTPAAGPIDLGDGEVHRLSLRLDPALYADHVITAAVTAPGIDGAVVSEVSLHDVDYRYADAGGSQDPGYSSSQDYGWLDGTVNTAWGSLAYQSVRVDQGDSELRYRFDNLDPAVDYNVHLTFWQPSGTGRIQQVRIDGQDVGQPVDTGDYQVHRPTVAVPKATYSGDGSIVVSIVRTNASAGAMVNEIALEQQTVAAQNVCEVQETPYFSEVYGDVTIVEQAAAPGSVIQAINPRGDTVGCFTVDSSGQYGFMRLYGEDTSAEPDIPGLRAGEVVLFRVNGALAVATPTFAWQDDRTVHQVDLAAGIVQGQALLLQPGWNLFSIRLEPPVPSVRQVLSSIEGRYDRVLGENGIYTTALPDSYNTLREIHAGLGYYLRITSATTTNALIEGTPVTTDTAIPLHPGWNWIGYLPTTTLPITQALQSIEGSYQRVLGLNKTYDPALPQFSTLKQLEPGQGYLLFAMSAISLTYPAGGSGSTSEAPAAGPPLCRSVQPTPLVSLAYGQIEVNGSPAPPGTRVEAVTPRSEVAGCFIVEQPGLFGLMHVYGEDDTATPIIPGFRAGEPLTFRVNGSAADTAISITWQDDRTPHESPLSGALPKYFLPIVVK